MFCIVEKYYNEDIVQNNYCFCNIPKYFYIEKEVPNMKKNKLKLLLYEITVRWRLLFYLIAGLMVLVPICIVGITGNALSSFYGKVFISTAFAFIIIGRIFTAFKKTIENGFIPWTSIGSVIGLLIVLVWIILK
jgi:hypothetical protein